MWSDAASDWPMSYESDELETEFNVDDNVIDEFWSDALTETDSSDDEFESAECLGEELRGWAIDRQPNTTMPPKWALGHPEKISSISPEGCPHSFRYSNYL